MLLHHPLLLQLFLYRNKPHLATPLASDAFLTMHSRDQATSTTECQQPLCINVKTTKSPLNLELFSRRLCGRSSHQVGLPPRTIHCLPGISPTDTPHLDDPALIACLSTYSKNHATAIIAQRHTNTHQIGKDNPYQNFLLGCLPSRRLLSWVAFLTTQSLPNSSLILSCPC